MRGNERKNLTIKKGYVRALKALRITYSLLPPLWLAFFMSLRLLKIDLPRRIDIIILASVVAVCFILFLIDSIMAKRKCVCPYCGRPWSMVKHRKFRHYPLDLINNTHEYFCYNCNENVDIV